MYYDVFNALSALRFSVFYFLGMIETDYWFKYTLLIEGGGRTFESAPLLYCNRRIIL